MFFILLVCSKEGAKWVPLTPLEQLEVELVEPRSLVMEGEAGVG